MNTKTLNTETELTDHQLKLLNMKRIFNARQALYEPIYYSISTENMDVYRALRKVQEELDRIEKLIEMAGE
jgi:hypothetical protein